MERLKKALILSIILMLSFSHTIVSGATASVLQFSNAELAFIENHPVIKMAVDPTFFPYEFIDRDGSYKGIASDYLELISQRTGITFIVPEGITWASAYEKAVLGELDMLSCVLKTPSRELYFNYSAPYYFTYRSIFVLSGNKGISQLSDLSDMTVAVQRNSSHHSFLGDYPNISPSLYDTVDEAIQAVSEGKETAFIGNFATTNYIIKQNGLSGLKSVPISADSKQGLHFAVKKDWPELVTILNKAIASITEEERITINNKWLGVETQVDYSRIIRIALMLGSLVSIVVIISLYWTVKLKKEVERRKVIEADLKIAKEEAESANQIKSTFLARMSHEIRTPLNAITGMSYILKKTDLTRTQEMYLDKISRASKDMLTIINDILDFSKIESGKVVLENISFKLDDVLEQLMNIVSFKIDEQHIDFRLNKEANIPAYLKGDPNRLEQILLNLVNNAIKFTKEGEVTLSIRNVARTKSFVYLEFSVKDTGIGMSSEQLSALFVPFTQADSSINRRFGGTGLGLSIVKHLTELMAGSVSVYSEPGEGSTFIVQIPFEEDYNKDYEDRKEKASVYFKNIRVLVIEKSIFHTNLLKEYLSAFNIIAEFVRTDTHALELLNSNKASNGHPYNLLIIDYDTPKPNGITFCENLKALDEPFNCLVMLPITKLELFDEIGSHERVLGITKPIIPSVMFNAILELFKINIIDEQMKIKRSHTADSENVHALNVLVVEDNKTNQFIAKSLLEQYSHQVIIAENGLEAVNYMTERGEAVDLILMDLHMPIMDGYEATKRIREINTIIPIIAMTADAITGVEEKCIEIGINRFISKPFDPDLFLQIVTESGKQSTVTESLQSNSITPGSLVYSTGLKSFGGNESLYKQVLVIYRDENINTAPLIHDLITQSRYEEASKAIHKLKSSTGTIGATDLYNDCIKLQQALNDVASDDTNMNQIADLASQFEVNFAKMLDEIDHYLKK